MFNHQDAPMDFSAFPAMYRAALIERDLAPLRACCRSDVRVHGSITGQDSTLCEVGEMLDTLRAALRFQQVHVLAQAGTADTWMAYALLDAALLATEAPIKIHGSIICRHEDGIVHDLVMNFDTISLFRAIGVLPDNVIELGLAGMRFAPLDGATGAPFTSA